VGKSAGMVLADGQNQAARRGVKAMKDTKN
jgi:hypothetical protein